MLLYIKGNGVCAIKSFPPGAFLLQYQGEIVTDEMEVEKREERYKREKRGCFMYFFKIHNTTHVVITFSLVFSGSNLQFLIQYLLEILS